jgi:hypothetical protein
MANDEINFRIGDRIEIPVKDESGEFYLMGNNNNNISKVENIIEKRGEKFALINNITKCGIYNIHTDEDDIYFSVNHDNTESNLRYYTDKQISEKLKNIESLDASLKFERKSKGVLKSVDLNKFLIPFLIFLVLLELVYSNYLSKKF